MQHRSDPDRPWFIAAFVLIVALMSLARYARADDLPKTLVLHYAPVGIGVRVTPEAASLLDADLRLEKPTLYRMYTVPEFLDIVRLDLAHYSLTRVHALLKEEAAGLYDLYRVSEARAESLETDLHRVSEESRRLFEKWKATDKERALAVARANAPWPWIVLAAGGALAIAGGTALAFAVLTK